MRRMYSEEEVVKLIQQYSPEVTPEDIQKMFDDGDVSLAGKYVRIMDAPESTTLTDDQIAQIAEGAFIKGTFLSRKNPVLFPATLNNDGSIYGGVMISKDISNRYTYIESYEVIVSTKTINRSFVNFTQLLNIGSINDKQLPAYPSNTGTFILKMVNGTLTWVEEA